MATVVYTPRNNRKAEAENRVAMQRMLDYYIDDEDGSLDRESTTATPESTPASPPTKKPAVRKHNAVPSKSTAKSTVKSSSEESHPTRRSPRTTKRTAKAIESDDAESEQSSPKKKHKTNAITTFEAPAGKKVEPAAFRKSTGRFTPINAQIKRAKKIEKRPTDITNAETVTNSKSGQRGVKRSADCAATDAMKPKPAKGAKRTLGAAGVSAAEVDKDMDEMNFEIEDEAAEANDTLTKPPFVGTSDHDGSSNEKPEGAQLTQNWKCANRNCNTGQTWHARDGQGGYGRKVVSHFFGRNKKETRFIHNDVWHIYCRKDYQRRTYSARVQGEKTKSAKPECDFFISNIEMQLVRIKIWRPQAMFKVQLTKGASARLDKYYKELNKNGGDEDRAAFAVTKTPKTGTKGHEKPLSLEDNFPIKKMKEFDDSFCDSEVYVDFDRLGEIMQWIRDQVNDGSIKSMPPMESLINEQGANDTTTDPTTNYDRWTAHEDCLVLETEETEDEDAETDSTVAGPSGTQNPPSDTDEIEVEVEASEAGDVTTKQAIDEGDIPDYESYVAETPLEDMFPTHAAEDAEDAKDDEDVEEAEEIQDGGYEYNDDSEPESEDEEEQPATFGGQWVQLDDGTWASLATTVGVKATTVGTTRNKFPGGVIRYQYELGPESARRRANDAISPLTPTEPKPFESENDAGEVDGGDAVKEDTIPAAATAGIDSGAESSA